MNFKNKFNCTFKNAVTGILSAGILALVFGSNASAQIPQTPSLKPKVYIGAGFSALTGPSSFTNNFGASLSFMGAISLPLAGGFEPVAKFHYHDYSLANAATQLGFTDPNTRFIMFGVDGKYSLGPPLVPVKLYLLGGGGILNLKQDAYSIGTAPAILNFPAISSSNFYFNIGAGVDLKLGPAFALFAEAKYTTASNDEGSIGFFPVLAGIRIL